MATLDDILVTEEKVEDNIFPNPPPAELDPRACCLAICTLNKTPPVEDIISTAAPSILGVGPGVPSPPATHLLSQTLLLPPMMHGSGKGFLLFTATRGHHMTPSVLTMQYPASVEVVPTNLYGALSAVLEKLRDSKGDSSPTLPKTEMVKHHCV